MLIKHYAVYPQFSIEVVVVNVVIDVVVSALPYNIPTTTFPLIDSAPVLCTTPRYLTQVYTSLVGHDFWY